MADEWYRSPDWGGAATKEFEARLAHSRTHNRQQYLRIKGLSLRNAGRLDAARELLERVAKYQGPDAYDHERALALFRWHLALISVAKAVGETETVRRAARTALRVAERGPQLPRHPDVGLVHADKATLRRLRRLARSRRPRWRGKPGN